MRYLSIVFVFLLCGVNISAQDSDVQKFYVGSYTSEGAEGIYLCELNLKTGKLIKQNTFSGIENPSFVKLSPDKNYLFVVSEVDEENSSVFAYKVGENNALIMLNKQPSGGAHPCHVDVSSDGNLVAVANYTGGSFSIYETESNGKLKAMGMKVQNSGSGPNEERQQKPHAHSVKFSPFSEELFNADLGTDQLNIWHLEGNKLHQEDQKFVSITPGAGPRHLDFHPDGETIYVINELNSTISVVSRIDGVWKVVQNISTLPAGFDGESFCADIHISKDGRFLYGSNRGHNSIAVFEIGSDQTLKMLETVSVEGDWPRNFNITPDGDWLLVANQRSGNISVFKVNKKNGSISFSGNEISLPAPVCIEFL